MNHQNDNTAGNMGFGVIGAGRCYLHHQQHGSSCSGRTNIGEHFILSCTSAKHQQRFRVDVFQIPQQRQALSLANILRLHIFILSFLFVGCKSSIDIDNIEQREHGLSYVKKTDKLVNGEVVRKLENGKTSELHNFKDGKPIGNWYAYGDNGKVLSHGFGVDAKKYENKLDNIDLTNSFLSINQTGNFTYATFYLDNSKLFENPNLMVNLSKEIFTEYSVEYKFEEVFLYDKEHEYTISKSATTNSSYNIDTVKDKDKKTIFIR